MINSDLLKSHSEFFMRVRVSERWVIPHNFGHHEGLVGPPIARLQRHLGLELQQLPQYLGLSSFKQWFDLPTIL